MKRILFFMRYYLEDSKDSLSSKFKSQIESVINLGYDVWFVRCDDNTIYLCHDDECTLVYKFLSVDIPIMSNIVFYHHFYKSINEIYKINPHFDYVYIRSMFPCLSAIDSLRIMKNYNSKIIMEIPTYPFYQEYKTEKNLFRKLVLEMSMLLEWGIIRYVDLYVLMGEKANKYKNKPALNIENGVNIFNIPLRVPVFNQKEIRILALASMSRWHGYDRLIEGLHLYKQNGGIEKVIIHMVGPEGDGSLAEWQKLAKKHGLEDEVIFEGSMYGDELTEIINRCDIGIASLGLNEFSNTSGLKIREYMARGLPFVYAWNDSSINEGLDYCLRVPNDSKPIDIAQVINFANKIRNNKNIPTEMRIYADKHMTWEKQFEKIFNWFQQKG